MRGGGRSPSYRQSRAGSRVGRIWDGGFMGGLVGLGGRRGQNPNAQLYESEITPRVISCSKYDRTCSARLLGLASLSFGFECNPLGTDSPNTLHLLGSMIYLI